MIKDSGNRREFDSGAVRDIAEGKGRCDLLPLDVIGAVKHDVILSEIGSFVNYGHYMNLQNALAEFQELVGWTFSDMCLEVSKHYEEGAKKYEERNWEKGIPLHCYIDSGVRHYLKWLNGENDERHDRAFVWNILGALWTKIHKPEMIDLPFKEKEE